MNKKENEQIENLTLLVSSAINSLVEKNQQLEVKITKLESQLEKKHVPANLERDILSSVQTSISDSIKSVLSGYNSPLIKLINTAVEQDKVFLQALISDAFGSVIRTEDFKQSIISAFSHKVSRTIISNNDGLFDKVSNELKQDKVFKSKMVLAVANVVEECLNDRKLQE
jgi:DNA-binding protein YbaB